MNKQPTIICLMGPTASGKTKLAIELTQQIPCEIISVDSAMVYRTMDIGTSTPTQKELKQAPHRLIDIRDPAVPYSAGQFCEDVQREIKDIHRRNKIPLLVGGTMLYFHLLQQGVADLPEADKRIRDQISAQAHKLGWPALHQQLLVIDPTSAKKIHPNDAQRIQRALEIYRVTGQPLSKLQALQDSKTPPYRTINLIIAPQDRSILHKRIATRFQNMLAQGFIDEVRTLFQREDCHENLPSIRTVGYRQIWAYLKGEYDYDTMQEKAIIATRQFAKRQWTWLRRWKEASWFDTDNSQLLSQILQTLEAS